MTVEELDFAATARLPNFTAAVSDALSGFSRLSMSSCFAQSLASSLRGADSWLLLQSVNFGNQLLDKLSGLAFQAAALADES